MTSLLLLVVSLALALQAAGTFPEPQMDGSFGFLLTRNITDVTRLETLVRAPDTDAEVMRVYVLRQAQKGIRVAAYARLGELGTPEALAAVSRIDSAIAAAATPAQRTAPLSAWATHPGPNMQDDDTNPLVAIDTGTGRLALMALRVAGGSDLFVSTTSNPANAAAWTRPRLTRVRSAAGRPEVAAVLESRRTLRVTFTSGTQESVTPRSERIDLDEVERDSDGDGWTDLEEARFGLQPRDRDTDKDGVPDGDDSCPNLAPRDESVHGDDAEILRRAVFAVFAVSGTRHPLLIDEHAPRVVIRGYSGLMLYGINQKAWEERNGSGGTFVTWRIVRQTADTAIVDVSDYEGLLAASGQHVWLKKLDGKWIVYARRSTWVS